MKKFYLFTLLSCCFFTAFSQKKAAVGLVVKAGNYTVPFQHTSESFNYYGERISKYTTIQNAGSAYSFGISGSLRLGGHFRVSSELLYRMVAYTFGSDQKLSTVPENTLLYTAHEKQQITESSLCLPVKVHFSFLKNGRTTLALGAGVFHILNVANKGYSETIDVGRPRRYNSYQFSDLAIINTDNKPEMTLTAGVYHRIDKNTTIGLEFNYERRAAAKIHFSKYDYFSDFGRPNHGYFDMEAPSVRSLSIALGHNLTQ